MSTRARTAVAAALLATAALAGCADAPVGPTTSTAPATATPAAAPAPPRPAAQRHADDVTYAQAMLSHVGAGLGLTAITPGRVADPDLARLVTAMDNADVEEQGQLTGQLRVWTAPLPDQRAAAGPERMPGTPDAATLALLRALRGPAFDRAWLEVMAVHHQGGIDMSRDYLARGGGELTGVAETTLGNGGRQLDQMRSMLTRS